MEYKLTCLCGCGHTSTADFRENVGVLMTKHIDDEHDTPVDPLKVGELALKRFDGAPLRRARQQQAL